MGIQFQILGPLEVRVDGVAVAIGGPRQRALLAMLLLGANRVVSRDRLIDELLDGTPADRAEGMLRVQVSRLRKVLETDDAERPRLIGRAPGYLLRVEPGELDLQLFQELLDEGHIALEQHDFERAGRTLREAESLWRGRPLADLEFERFARIDIERLEELRLVAGDDRIEAELALGRQAMLVPELEARVAEHPLRERPRGQLMLALYRCGRQADALETYRAGRSLLSDELALEPSRALRALEGSILRQEPGLELAERDPVHGAQPTRGPPGLGDRSELELEPVAAAPGPPVDPPRTDPRFSRWGAGVAASVALAALVAAAFFVVTGAPERAAVPVSGNSVALIAPSSNGVVGQISVGAGPDGITVGPGGIWVANTEDHSLSNIDPSSRKVARNVSLGGTVDGVVADSRSLWALDSTRDVAERIDPTFGTVIGTINLAPGGHGSLPSSPTTLAAGAGSVWFANQAAGVVQSPDRGYVTSETDVGNHASGIAVGEGATWVADDIDDTVSRIDPNGGVSATIPVGRGASGIAVGGGAAWVAETLDNALARIDPATDSVTNTVRVGVGPRGVAFGDGSVWVANSGDGTVSRVDPRTDRVTATIHVGQSPQALLVTGGKVWVTVQARPIAVTSAPGGPPGVLRMLRQRPFASLDPPLASFLDADQQQLLYATCAGLLMPADRPGTQGGRLVPDAAQAFPTVSRDGRTYTFAVRRGFRFSPPASAPLTADTFKHTIERALSPRVGGYEPSFMGDIVGMPAYEAGKARHLAGVVAQADKLQIRLTAPAPDFPARLSSLSFCAVPDDTPDAPQHQPIPTAGPYYIASSNRTQLILARNPNYGGHRPQVPRGIIYSFGLPFQTAVADVAAGKSDYVSAVQLQLDANVPAGLFQSLERRYGLESATARAGHQRYFVNPTTSLDSFALNTRRPLFASTRLRQAVNYAIDRQALVQRAGPFFGGQPISHYLPPGMPGARPAAIYPLGAPNLAKARKLAAGVHAHATMLTCNIAACIHTAQVVQKDLKAIGITVDITAMPLDALYGRLNTPGDPWDIGWQTYGLDYADPSDFLSGLFDHAANGVDFGGFEQSDPQWVAAIRRARALSGQRRLQNYGLLDNTLASRAAPIVAWSTQAARDLFAARVGCQIYQPLYGIDLGNLCLRQ